MSGRKAFSTIAGDVARHPRPWHVCCASRVAHPQPPSARSGMRRLRRYPQIRGSVGPKTATAGRPNAVASWVIPESFPKNSSQLDRTPTTLARLTSRSRGRGTGTWRATACVTSSSAGPWMRTTLTQCLSKARMTAAKRSDGQHLLTLPLPGCTAMMCSHSGLIPFVRSHCAPDRRSLSVGDSPLSGSSPGGIRPLTVSRKRSVACWLVSSRSPGEWATTRGIPKDLSVARTEPL